MGVWQSFLVPCNSLEFPVFKVMVICMFWILRRSAFRLLNCVQRVEPLCPKVLIRSVPRLICRCTGPHHTILLQVGLLNTVLITTNYYFKTTSNLLLLINRHAELQTSMKRIPLSSSWNNGQTTGNIWAPKYYIFPINDLPHIAPLLFIFLKEKSRKKSK